MKKLLTEWRKYLKEEGSWEDTHWTLDDGKKIMIGQLLKYMKKDIELINAQNLMRDIIKARGGKGLPTQGQKRIDRADLSFPVIVAKQGGEYISVLDGNHRLQKAADDPKIEDIKARVLDLDDPAMPPEYVEHFGIK